MKFMPEGIVSYDHAETVNALAQGDVAFITEWSAFYSTLKNPETSKIADCLKALGGFSLAVAAQADEKEQAAAWLFIQWVTSKENALEYLERGGVPARQSVYQMPGVAEKFDFVPALVELAGRRARIPPALRRMARDHRDRAGMGHEDDAGRGERRGRRAHHRRADGSGAGKGRLLLGQEAADPVAMPQETRAGGGPFWTSLHFFNLTKLRHVEFIGLENYGTVLSDPVFWEAMGRTFTLLLIALPLQIALGLGIALILHRPG